MGGRKGTRSPRHRQDESRVKRAARLSERHGELIGAVIASSRYLNRRLNLAGNVDMSISPDEILKAAFNLSDVDRLTIVNELLSTLPDQVVGSSADDPQFLDELDRRQYDGSASVPSAQVLAVLRDA